MFVRGSRAVRSRHEGVRSAVDDGSLATRTLHVYGPPRDPNSVQFQDRMMVQHIEPHYASMLETEHNEKIQNEELKRIPLAELEKLGTITVLNLDFHIKENAHKHNTLLYHCVMHDDPQAVLRRGQEFFMTLTFSRPYQNEIDDLHFILEADNKSPAKNLRVEFTVDETGNATYKKDEAWGARIVVQYDEENKVDTVNMKIAVYIPGHCVVGEWDLKIRTTLVDSKTDYMFVYPKPVIILFNPWSAEDQTHFTDDKDLLNEYILNESGTVFSGTSNSIGSRSWNYGQFDEGILQVSLSLLRKAFGFKKTPAMASVVDVSRALSRVINSLDDDGVLEGNWSGDYRGGKSPSSWKSSTAILRQFAETGAPVKYGQCWVFAQVLTTVCRALGIPCRSVTNFSSAHDTDNTCTIDKYYDLSGNALKGMNNDSIWNFHVWNEVWILRPDLPSGYDGWHVIDATPQEMSYGMYQCGPCPVAAVRKGDIHIGFDTAFVFSEVNAEVVTWVVEDGDKLTPSGINTSQVGHKISTKVPDGLPSKGLLGRWNLDDSMIRLDITDKYKAPDDSADERRAVEKAVRYMRFGCRLFDKDSSIEVTFQMGEQTMVGDDLIVTSLVKNVSSEERTVTVTMTARTTTYWDRSFSDENLAKENFADVTIKPAETATFKLTISANVYLAECDESLSLFVYACARDVQKDMPYSCQQSFRLRRPDLIVKGPEVAKSGEPVEVVISFTNPLHDRSLTGCSFEMDGGLTLAETDERFEVSDSELTMLYRDVKPNDTVSITVKLKGETTEDGRSKSMQLGFSSKELPELVGVYVLKLSI